MVVSSAFITLFLCLIDFCYSQAVITVAGSGTAGTLDDVGTNAQLNYPRSIAIDSSGNLYVVDANNNRIRKITPSGIVSTLAGSTAGSANGVGTNAQFNQPFGIAIDSGGNLYVGDMWNNKVRKIATDGTVTTFAGSGAAGTIDAVGTNARFYYPAGIAIDSSGNLYVCDYYNSKIRKVTSTGTVTTFAGSGTVGTNNGMGTNAQFYWPYAITGDPSGNIYVADTYNDRIRKITSAGSVSTFAGSSYGFINAVGTNAKFYNPYGIAIESNGNVYVGDNNNNRIRMITPTGTVSTFAGSGTAGTTDGVGTNARFSSPQGILIDSNGNFYFADANNNKIRKINGPPNCPAGTLLSSGQCASCSPGTFSNSTNSQNCTACPAGTFAANFRSTNCTICPQGSFCPSVGLINATLCPVNKYCPLSGLTQPIDCPLNSTNLNSGSVLSADCLCDAGFYKNGSVCAGCPAGSYCPQNSTFPIACPVGYYCPSALLNSPTICPQSTFCPYAGLISATLCPLNKYCPQSGLILPVDCPLNSSNIFTGSVSIADCVCDAGFYKNGTICVGCPAGSYCPHNSSLPITCPVGYHCPSDFLNSPVICPQGYYCSSVGLTVATQCGANSGTTGTGSTSSANCICNQGYSIVGGICTLNQVTTSIAGSTVNQITTPTALSNPTVSLSVDSVNSLTISSQIAGSLVSSSDVQVVVQASSQIDRSSSINSGGGGGLLAAAFSNPAFIAIASGTCLLVSAAIFNAVVAYRRISKAKLRRKVGVTYNLTAGGVTTNGRSTAGVTTAEA